MKLQNTAEGARAFLQFVHTEEISIASYNDRSIEIAASPYHSFVTSPSSDLHICLSNGEVHWIDVKSGSILYIPSRQSFLIRNSAALHSKVLIISFEFIVSDNSAVLVKPPHSLKSFHLPQMKSWMTDFTSNGDDSSTIDYYQLQSRLYAIASACRRSAAKTAQEPSELTLYVKNTKQSIQENYDTALDMEGFAKSSGSGSSQFYRTFRKQTGLSPLKFVITTRLNASLRLLADPAITVTEAAHSVGYSDEYYFSRLFKKEMGITPTQYAARANISIANLCLVFTGDLSVLGLTPSVSLQRDWDLDNANLDKYLKDIAAAQPQHILTGPISETLYKSLSLIAPVCMLKWYEIHWKQRLLEFGRLLDLETVAQRFLVGFQHKIDNARQHVKEHYPNTSFLIIGVREDNLRIFGTQKRKFTDLLVEEMGFKAPVEAENIGFMDVSTVKEAAEISSVHALFIIEFPATESYCKHLEEEWKQSSPNKDTRGCLFIHLDEPFIYNAAMHELLVDQIVNHLHTAVRTK